MTKIDVRGLTKSEGNLFARNDALQHFCAVMLLARATNPRVQLGRFFVAGVAMSSVNSALSCKSEGAIGSELCEFGLAFVDNSRR